jgi:SAM-dependent methyltransferase
VIELGGRNVNGGVRDLFADASEFVSVDLEPGRDVDVVWDASTVDLGHGVWDVVVCCEVLEHAEAAAEIVANAYRHLKPQGRFVMTCAGEGRDPHGCDGGGVGEEFYRNVSAEDIDGWLLAAGFESWTVDVFESDTRCVAWR